METPLKVIVILALLALVVNGTVKVVGKVPSVEEIKKLLA
jgi:hypothetical protein